MGLEALRQFAQSILGQIQKKNLSKNSMWQFQKLEQDLVALHKLAGIELEEAKDLKKEIG